MVESIKKLREICYANSKDKRPLYMEWVTMKFSIYITKLLLYTPIRADHVTISMVLLVILGSVFMGFGTLKFLLIGILIIHLTVFLDNVNGEVARYRKEGNMTGTFLEQFYHEVSLPLIFFSLSFGVFLQTGFKSVLIFGLLCAIFSRPVVLIAIHNAVVKNGIRDNKRGRISEKLKKSVALIGKADIKGGSTETGRKLYKTYDYIREFWNFPSNIVHINIIVILEIINRSYNFLPPYILLYAYLLVYGIISVIIQLMSFIVHYKGKTVFHYYVALYGKKQK